MAGRDGTVVGAVYNLRTGTMATIGDGAPQAEASIVKVDILETLLSQAGHEGGLPAVDQPLALNMIEYSDNDAATDLWNAAGGAAGIGSFDSLSGLTHTAPSQCVQCPGFPWPGWGLTTTTPSDLIVLLHNLVEPNAILSPSDRDYVLQLMENVTAPERWGVSGGVPPRVTVALKNGWLPLNDANTDWQVNSIGWVSGLGRDYLMAVLSTGNPTEQYGIDTIDQLSALAWEAAG